MQRLALAVVCLVACQGGGGGDKPTNASGSAPTGSEAGFSDPAIEDALSNVIEIDAAKIEEPEPADSGKLIAELGAIPAWQAVIDRAQLLARRGQRGVVYGTIGPQIMVLGPAPEPVGSAKPIDAGLVASPYVWLVDDTDGNGTLGIRVMLEKPLDAGARVALTGSWLLDDAKRWYWKVDTVTPLPARTPSENDVKDPPAAVPSHEVVMGNLAPGSRTITVARDNDAVYFQLVGPPPVRDGDGWLVANELGDVPFARLTLPGERPAYGGQDMRAADERWNLKRAQTYWVRIGKIRKSTKPTPPGANPEPASINARTAPVRVN